MIWLWGAWAQEGRLSKKPWQCSGDNVVPLGRGGPQGCDPRHNRFYALHGRQGVGEVPDVITGMLKIFDFYVYTLIDPGATLFFVTHFVAKKFQVIPKLLHESYEVSIPIGASIIARKIYRSCPICILHKLLLCDLVELDMCKNHRHHHLIQLKV
ncbi:MAG: hypothetical protein Q8834_02910, partial [Candidatus Phytoplasma australasiaticum]|nr:hypothetical protein [Candidatus Phytoplasma australasiaticum]